MKQTLRAPLPESLRPRRLGVAEAKSRLSEVLRDTFTAPAIIHSRGHDVAVILAIEEYERLLAGRRPDARSGAGFLARVDALRQRHGGGVDDFEPARLDFQPAEPFSRARRRA